MDAFEIKPILEGLIFVSDSPVRLDTLAELMPELDREVILEGIRRIKEEYEADSKGLELMEIAGGYQFRTKPRWAEWIARLKKAKPVKLSQSALETLAIIAYRQPVIRPEIDDIRGVDSGWSLRGLLEKGLIRIAGRKDLPGRPIIYGTTKAFLELFSLNALTDLPSLREIQPPPATGETMNEPVGETISELTQEEIPAAPVEESAIVPIVPIEEIPPLPFILPVEESPTVSVAQTEEFLSADNAVESTPESAALEKEDEEAEELSSSSAPSSEPSTDDPAPSSSPSSDDESTE
jgi:segregation and condensation protein B